MKISLTFLLLFLWLSSQAQTYIYGSVSSTDGAPIVGVNIMIQGSYTGTASDGNGRFSMTYMGERTGKQLYIKFIGFKPQLIDLEDKDSLRYDICLREDVTQLTMVQISAGSFMASDDERAAALKPLDVYTNPSALGDLSAAIRSLPGAQTVSASGQILVRGGDESESSIYIDGVLAADAYQSELPDVPSRAKFDSELFTGIQLSSGGYSAEYGQALSSVLELNTNGLSQNTSRSLGLTSIGLNGSLGFCNDNQSLSLTGSYTNMAPYYAIFPSIFSLDQPFQSLQGTLMYRVKPTEQGLMKCFASADWDDVSYSFEENGSRINIVSQNRGAYFNSKYSDLISDKILVYAAFSSSIDDDHIELDETVVDTRKIWSNAKLASKIELSSQLLFHTGLGYTFQNYLQKIDSNERFSMNFKSHLFSGFGEFSYSPTNKQSLRAGLRSEYSQILTQWVVEPRVAIAQKIGNCGQASLAWGIYHQNPTEDILKFTSDLQMQRAEHWILNYQIDIEDKRLFRVELYHKRYEKLITYNTDNNTYLYQINNLGDGYAQGIDLFLKEYKLIKYTEVWMTYSYVDTKRQYNNYQTNRTPDYVANHTASLVGKYWSRAMNTQFGASYTYASPRTTINELSDEKTSYKTNHYHSVDLNVSYLFYIGDQYSVLHFAVTNVLGRNNVLSHRYSYNMDNPSIMVPQLNDQNRFFFLGLFLEF